MKVIFTLKIELKYNKEGIKVLVKSCMSMQILIIT